MQQKGGKREREHSGCVLSSRRVLEDQAVPLQASEP